MNGNGSKPCAPPLAAPTTPILEAKELKRYYMVGGNLFQTPSTLRAVDNASFALWPNRTLAVVGESGCGKSTLARLVTLIEPPTAGSLTIGARPAGPREAARDRTLRTRVQIVFQDPFGSLNPRQSIGRTLMEPLRLSQPALSARERRERARNMLDLVGLRPEHFDRYPHMFSGGQRQRIAIARALMPEPEILVLDEPVSALDLSIQGQILNLLIDLQRDLGLAYLFISHDLSVVRYFADEIIVMYLGRIVEQGPKERIFEHPQHPYTKALLSATPQADPGRRRERIKLTGELPSPLAVPPGCAFNTRCQLATARCGSGRPQLENSPGHASHRFACFHPVDEGGEF